MQRQLFSSRNLFIFCSISSVFTQVFSLSFTPGNTFMSSSHSNLARGEMIKNQILRIDHSTVHSVYISIYLYIYIFTYIQSAMYELSSKLDKNQNNPDIWRSVIYYLLTYPQNYFDYLSVFLLCRFLSVVVSFSLSSSFFFLYFSFLFHVYFCFKSSFSSFFHSYNFFLFRWLYVSYDVDAKII